MKETDSWAWENGQTNTGTASPLVIEDDSAVVSDINVEHEEQIVEQDSDEELIPITRP